MKSSISVVLGLVLIAVGGWIFYTNALLAFVPFAVLFNPNIILWQLGGLLIATMGVVFVTRPLFRKRGVFW